MYVDTFLEQFSLNRLVGYVRAVHKTINWALHMQILIETKKDFGEKQ